MLWGCIILFIFLRLPANFGSQSHQDVRPSPRGLRPIYQARSLLDLLPSVECLAISLAMRPNLVQPHGQTTSLGRHPLGMEKAFAEQKFFIGETEPRLRPAGGISRHDSPPIGGSSVAQ